MTQNRCRLFKAVMDTMPSKPEEYNFPVSWQNGKTHRQLAIKDLMREAKVKTKKLNKMNSICEEGEPDESIIETVKMPFRY